MSDALVTLEIVGEGKTDIGEMKDDPEPPTKGVVPILVHKLCGSPDNMRVKRKRLAHLQGKGIRQKVRYAKCQAYYNAGTVGAVFVLDTEGDRKVRETLERGRDHAYPGFPMAVGAAHPCIEAWLLCDAAAIQRAMKLDNLPELPEEPESLFAPCKRRDKNPKTELQRVAGVKSARDKDEIARQIDDLSVLRQRCQQGFAPFAEQVERHIAPLFG